MNNDDFTIKEYFIEVGDGHSLYVHDWGNPKAKTPIVFLHGGPGACTKDKHKAMFVPERQRVIFFDQRGAGRSLPYGSLKKNTTMELVEDIEKIAKHLKLDKFILNGGSWGSALALFYALKYPKRVKAMVLRGIFTCTKNETEWLDQGQFKTFYPEVWQRYLDATPKNHRHSPSAYHYKRILGGKEAEVRASAYAYSCLEYGAIALDDRFMPGDPAEFDPVETIIETHYLSNYCFMPDRYILDNARKLKMPVYLVQGRYDMVCPPATAYELSKQLPNGELITTIAGHRDEHESWNIARSLLLQLTGRP